MSEITASLPAGAAEASEWTPDDHRAVYGADRRIENHGLILWTSGTQFADGRVEDARVHIDVLTDEGLTGVQTSQLIALLLDARDQLDHWAQ
jgi:hypothetical protein